MSSIQSAQASASGVATKEDHSATAHHGQKMTQISVRSLRAATYARLGEVSMKHRNGVNVVAKVLRVLSLLEHTGMDGALYRDVDVYIGDETAVMRVQASGVHVDALMSVGKPIVIRNALVESVAHDTTGQSGPICLKLKQFSKVALHPDGVMSTPAAPTKINTTYNRSIFTSHPTTQQQSFSAEQEAPTPGTSVLQPAASAWPSVAGKQQKQSQSAPSHAPAPAPAAAPAAAPTGWAAVAARGASTPAAVPVRAAPSANAAAAASAPAAAEQAVAPVQEAAPAPVAAPVAAPSPAPAVAGTWAAVASAK